MKKSDKKNDFAEQILKSRLLSCRWSCRWLVLDTDSKDLVTMHTDGNEQLSVMCYGPGMLITADDMFPLYMQSVILTVRFFSFIWTSNIFNFIIWTLIFLSSFHLFRW